MKHGSEYAKRVKRLFNRLLRKYGRPAEAELTDPIEQLVLGILSQCTSAAKARTVYRKLCDNMVDLNELRVTPPIELMQLFGSGFSFARMKAQRIVDALNAIRKRQDTLDLSFLKQRGRREARSYLESLDGVDKTAAASVILYSLGGHAIPIDDLKLYVLRKEEIIDEHADAAEVQAFLERHISAKNARTFTELLDRFVSTKAARIPVNKLPELLSPPPEPAKEVALAETSDKSSAEKSARKKPPVFAKKKTGAASQATSTRKVKKDKKSAAKRATTAKAKRVQSSPKKKKVKKQSSKHASRKAK
ncbi:MAG: hypothetical protein JSV03_15380 [Planctomycetota bacterium]|nr:MAG: hypothetical protein JSV03_15380 [Planctomycetota bacterium]